MAGGRCEGRFAPGFAPAWFDAAPGRTRCNARHHLTPPAFFAPSGLRMVLTVLVKSDLFENFILLW